MDVHCVTGAGGYLFLKAEPVARVAGPCLYSVVVHLT